MKSIRTRLFAALLAATGLVWLSAVLWIQHSTRFEVNHVLDRRLEESARMVASLIARQGIPASGGLFTPSGSGGHDPFIAHQLVCQIWGIAGDLKSGSAGAPVEALSEGRVSGFSQTELGTGAERQVWRVYTHIDPQTGIRVMVGDALAMRDGLVSGVLLGLTAPAVLLLPMLAVLIWLGASRGLRPLSHLARQLEARDAEDLSPLSSAGASSELAPMLRALNGLFARVEGQRAREQSFTAFAAHELKTPLAGLRTQAEIARLAPDVETRLHALEQIRRGVDRTDRLARQLLDLTAAETQTAIGGAACQPLHRLVGDVARDLAPMAEARGVRLDIALDDGAKPAEVGALLSVALRNLIENAVQASPQGSSVDIRAARQADAITLTVCDRGRGIPESERARITERFFRGAAARSGGGSGLGLSIVETAVERLGGRMRHAARKGGGETATLTLPAPGRA